MIKTNTRRSGANWKFIPKQDVIIKKETVPANMRPAGNGEPNIAIPGNDFSARPIKHWRKQRVPVYPVGSQTPGNTFTNSKALAGTFEVPGGTNVVSVSTQCIPCENQVEVPAVNVTYRPKDDINNKIGHFAPESFADYNDYLNQCPPNHLIYDKCVSVCDPEKKARQRVRYPSAINTDSSKPKYYQSNASYMRARCRTYEQNSFQYGGNKTVSKCQNLVQPGAFRPNCQGCSNCKDKGICEQKISYYKPNNCKFAVQGGVSSGLRVARLKYDTITTFANGFVDDPNFGPAVANAYAYSGRPDTPFTLKNKLFNCSQNATIFRRTGNRNIKC
jgi:hypothetical protein